MAKAKQKEIRAKITINFYADDVEVDIENFERLNMAKLENAFPFVVREWFKRQREYHLVNQPKSGPTEEKLNA